MNDKAFGWAKANVPFFECDDKDLEAAYAFRWRAYYTHIVPTGYPRNPYVVTECANPEIPGRCNWGKPFGTINAAAGHHIREGRWIRDPIYMDSNIRFWFGVGNTYGNGSTAGGGGDGYSDWITHAAWSRADVSGDAALFAEQDVPSGKSVLDGMIRRFEQREISERVDLVNKNDALPHCYYKSDGYDAMEGSISGNGCRPSNNAMFYGNALAISRIAAATGNTNVAAEWAERADTIRTMYLKLLWNTDVDFFTVYKDGSPARQGQANSTNGLPFGFPNDICGIPSGSALPLPPPQPEPWRYRPFGCPVTSSWHNQYKYSNQSFACNATVPVRELLGLGPPWYFEIPPGNTGVHSVDAVAYGGGGGGSDQDANYLAAWEQLFDPEGFQAVWGPTTAEQRHRCFNWSKATDECNWAGPSWYACPSSTSFLYTLERILLGASSSRSSAR